jgi:Tol biopolymer transport system component
MRRDKVTLVSGAVGIAALGTLLGGCGGAGGGGGSTAAGAASQEMNVGGLVTRVAGTSQAPITVSGQGAVVTGIAGGTVSSLTYTAPPPTPDNSAATLAQTQIVFHRISQVYVMGVNGANAHALTTSYPTLSNTTSPAWRPDGMKIAFSRYDPTVKHFQIYTMGPNGTSVTKVSDGSGDDTAPSWSPDGTKIVFVHWAPAVVAHNQIWTMASNGGSPQTVDDGTTDDRWPSYSPDGTKILFSRYEVSSGHYQIYTIAAGGGSPHNVCPISGDLASPTISPDGTKIAFSWLNGANSNIYMIRADGLGGWQSVTFTTMNDTNPTWSPDGTKIAFERTDTTANNHEQIYVVNLDQTDVHRISDGLTDDKNPNWGPYLKTRRFIGSGGTIGTTASGFLVGQQGKAQTSLVVFNAVTPDSAHLDTQSATVLGQPNLVFTVSGDQLNALSYVNGLSNSATTILSPSTTATGAVVSFDASDGSVTGVFPYISNRAVGHAGAPSAERTGDTLVYHGQFLGVWDAAGNNRATGGATEVRIDSRSGKLIAFH